MNCHDFELELQRRADGEPWSIDDRAMSHHVRECEVCRDLQRGFGLIARSMKTRLDPARSKRIVDSVCSAAVPQRPRARVHRTPRVAWLAAAAVLGAVWLVARRPGTDHEIPVASTNIASPASNAATALFPDLAGQSELDRRDALPIAGAVEPVTRLLRAVGRSLEAPVRPIAISTSEAMGNLIRDVSDPTTSMTPIIQFGEWMGPVTPKSMSGEPPSS